MKSERKNRIITMGVMTLLITTVLSVSYGFLRVEKEGKKHKVVAGVFNVEFKDGETIELNNTYPMTKEEGMNTKAYTFTIENKGNVDAKYTVKLEDDKTIDYKKRLNEDQIKYSIKVGEEGWSDAKLLSDTNSILVDNKELKESSPKVECSLKIWIDEKVGNEGQDKSYSGKIVVEAIQGNIKTDELESSTSPIIILEGDYVEYIEQNGKYEDKGVKEVKDDKDNLLKEKVTKKIEYYNGNTTEVVDEVNTENIGVYYITYSISDNEGNEGKVVRTVNVYKKDTTPTIEINGESKVTIKQDGEYIERGAHAEDNGKDITDRIVTEGVVNTKVPGVYIIKYIVTDEEGNTASTTR